MKVRRVLPLVLVALLVGGYWLWTHRTFTSQEWHRTELEQRYVFVDDLIGSDRPPDSLHLREGFYYLSYVIADGDGFNFNTYMHVHADPKTGKVNKVTISQD